MNSQIPPEFAIALQSLRDARVPALVELKEVSAPQSLSPLAAALALKVAPIDPDDPPAHARFVVLYDPDEQPGWDGRFRLVWSLHSPIDADVLNEPAGIDMIWAWIHEALEDAHAPVTNLVGTVTSINSQSFGGLTLTGRQSQVEVRASMTPMDAEIGPHLIALANLLGLAGGYAPLDLDPLHLVHD